MFRRFVYSAFLCVLILILQRTAAAPGISRNDFHIHGEPGIEIFVREVIAEKAAKVTPQAKAPSPILLIHGARVPGIASFDLSVPGGSLAEDLVRQGFVVYIMDVRGYGRSTRPQEMSEPPSANAPLVRSNEAARDIAAVVNWIQQRRHTARVALFGWATGGQWASYYSSIYPDNVNALIVLNALYGATANHPMLGPGSDLEDPTHPGRFNQSACGAYRYNDAASLFGVWDRSIPDSDKNLWRDPAVTAAYAEAALASDPASNSRTPPSFRSPCGALEDSFYLASGRQLWDASLITSPVLIIRSERDFWSRPEDVTTLANFLVHSPKVKVVTISGATHFVHLERPERGRNILLTTVVEFLNENTPAR